MNSCATVIGAEPGRSVAKTRAGSGALAVQQFVPMDWWDLEARKQQLWAALCAGCRQIPDGASKVPIKTMVTAARWKTPLNMVSSYHNSRVIQ
jgi:hypothetical protein